jgi:NADPH:quinone reductase-like Zn-dependent oxidoreductase
MTTPASALTRKPTSIDDVGAATLPVAALTALSEVDAAAPRDGQVILVIGATGGVGSFATQLAAKGGARVVAVTRGEYADYARSLGAADVVDYTKGDLLDLVKSRFPDGVDAILDNAGDKALLLRLAELVRPRGRLVSVVGAVDEAALEGRGVDGMNVGRASLERLAELTQLVEDGVLRLPAVRDYPLEKAGDALKEQASRHVKGKLVLIV